MSGIQYYNHPEQTTDWRLCYFCWLQCIYLRCPANQRTNWSYWKFSNTCKQDWIEKLPKPCKLHLPWTWIMLQTHFDHYRRQYGIEMVTQSLHNHSMQTNHNQIQTCNPWTRRLSNIIAINKRRLQINWTRRHQNDIRRPSSNLSEITDNLSERILLESRVYNFSCNWPQNPDMNVDQESTWYGQCSNAGNK